jgi:CBS domain-containing protein
MRRPSPHMSYKSRAGGRPLDFHSRLRKEEGNIMSLARRSVITIQPTTRIKEAAELMVKNKVRRLPVVDPGTKRMIGILITRDILDFLGGGEKSKIIQIRFKGNFLAAINDAVRTIMSEKVICGTSTMSVNDAAQLLWKTGMGGAPILDENQRVVGIVSERDFVTFTPAVTGTQVGYHMTRNVITAEPELQIKEAAKKMVSLGVRRLPVVEARALVGIITSVDILRYFGTSKMFEYMSTNRVDEAMSVGVEDTMTRDVLTTTPNTDVGEAARLMVEHGCGGLPVIEGDELVGIITERDILELLI